MLALRLAEEQRVGCLENLFALLGMQLGGTLMVHGLEQRRVVGAAGRHRLSRHHGSLTLATSLALCRRWACSSDSGTVPRSPRVAAVRRSVPLRNEEGL